MLYPCGKNGRTLFILLVFLLTGLPGCTNSQEAPARYSCAIVNSYPHDTEAFTQGLAWDLGRVYEGTGLYGRSSLRLVDLRTGRVVKKLAYDQRIFAEGVTVFRDRIYQLTWKNNLVFAFDKDTLSHLKTWTYPGEGWGITHDGRSIIVSDGTAVLSFLDPDSMDVLKRITVHDLQGPVRNLNELEFVKGTIYANIWQTNRIALIDPESGRVKGWLDLSELMAEMDLQGQQKVPNGIMYAPEEDRLFVTGKLWPLLFEIRLQPGT